MARPQKSGKSFFRLLQPFWSYDQTALVCLSPKNEFFTPFPHVFSFSSFLPFVQRIEYSGPSVHGLFSSLFLTYLLLPTFLHPILLCPPPLRQPHSFLMYISCFVCVLVKQVFFNAPIILNTSKNCILLYISSVSYFFPPINVYKFIHIIKCLSRLFMFPVAQFSMIYTCPRLPI